MSARFTLHWLWRSQYNFNERDTTEKKRNEQENNIWSRMLPGRTREIQCTRYDLFNDNLLAEIQQHRLCLSGRYGCLCCTNGICAALSRSVVEDICMHSTEVQNEVIRCENVLVCAYISDVNWISTFQLFAPEMSKMLQHFLHFPMRRKCCDVTAMPERLTAITYKGQITCLRCSEN